MQVPYAIEPRPDTGFSNATLGIWLFLASETMLFGALFSSYVLLRTGAASSPDGWPHGWQRLNLTIGSLQTMVMLLSGVTMLYAQRASQRGARAAARRGLTLTVALGLLLLIIEGLVQRAHLRAGEVPARDTFFAIYFVLTGVHALHVAGGLIAMVWLSHRVETIARYWWFVDVVWLVLFVSCYLT